MPSRCLLLALVVPTTVDIIVSFFLTQLEISRSLLLLQVVVSASIVSGHKHLATKPLYHGIASSLPLFPLIGIVRRTTPL